MKLNKVWGLCILMLIVLPTFLFSLEIKEGKIRLVLHEKTGRFSAYYLQDVRQNKYVSFFLDQDPRTSSFSVLEGNRVFRMGEASGFQQITEKTPDGARFVWKSASFEVTQEFSFLRSATSPLANGFSITLAVKNTSEQDINIALKYIFDTYLGEDANVHFRTEANRNITTETSFDGFSLPAYVVSTDGSADGLGFMAMIKDGGVSMPDQVIIANWKRLNDASWSYTANETRNFNQLPYSINDSALALYYNSVILKKGEEKKAVLVMGAHVKEGFSVSATPSSSPIAQMFQNALVTKNQPGQDIESAIRTDLITISDLLEKLNEKLTTGGVPTAEELKIFRQVIDELARRKTQYDSQ